MRGLFTFAVAAILLLAVFIPLQGITGDALFAVVLELVLLSSFGPFLSRLGDRSRQPNRL